MLSLKVTSRFPGDGGEGILAKIKQHKKPQLDRKSHYGNSTSPSCWYVDNVFIR